jgi:hypothetical protein
MRVEQQFSVLKDRDGLFLLLQLLLAPQLDVLEDQRRDASCASCYFYPSYNRFVRNSGLSAALFPEQHRGQGFWVG